MIPSFSEVYLLKNKFNFLKKIKVTNKNTFYHYVLHKF